MRRIREALRLRASGLTCLEVGDNIGVGRTSASTYLARAERAGLSWPLTDEMTDAALEALPYPPVPPDAAATYPLADLVEVRRCVETGRKRGNLVVV